MSPLLLLLIIVIIFLAFGGVTYHSYGMYSLGGVLVAILVVILIFYLLGAL